MRRPVTPAPASQSASQLPAIDGESDSSPSPPSKPVSRARGKVPAKAKTPPAKSKAKSTGGVNKSKKTPSPKTQTTTKRTSKSPSPGSGGDDEDEDVQILSSSSAQPSTQPAAPSKPTKSKTAKGKGKAVDKTYKDVPEVEDEDEDREPTAVKPAAKALAGTKRKVAFLDESFKLDDGKEEANSSPVPPRPNRHSTTRKLEVTHQPKKGETAQSISCGGSPKRQRTSPPAAARPSNQLPEQDAQDALDPIQAARALFEGVMNTPRPLKLDQISALFMVLQEEIATYCQKHFNFDLTPAQQEAWPMHLLATKYIKLQETTQFIADGSSVGWRNFFTRKEHRRHLVHGIIGEWFQERIFKHTAFGFGRDQLTALEDIDHRYLRYDAFVRNRRKAEWIEGSRIDDDYFPIGGDNPTDDEDFPINEQFRTDVGGAIIRLADSMMTLMLEPLLPPPCFDPLVPARWPRALERESSALKAQEIFLELCILIQRAVALHHCIRFSGASGLMVNFARHAPKGTFLTINDADRDIYVNANDLNHAANRPEADDDLHLQIKMTCFGRVEAVMPTGLDLEQMENEQEAAAIQGRELIREEAERNLFPVLPYELQETEQGRQAATNLDPVPGTEWNAALHRRSMAEHMDTNYERGRTPTWSPRPQGDAHPYVTLYPHVAPANLYCEWASSSSFAAQSSSPLAALTTAPRPQTLDEAVRQARRKKFITSKLEDAWNTATSPYTYELIAAGLATLGTLIAAEKILTSQPSKAVANGVVSGAVGACSALSSGVASASSYWSSLLASNVSAITTAAALISYSSAPASIVTAPPRVSTSTVTEETTSTIYDQEIDVDVEALEAAEAEVEVSTAQASADVDSSPHLRHPHPLRPHRLQLQPLRRPRQAGRPDSRPTPPTPDGCQLSTRVCVYAHARVDHLWSPLTELVDVVPSSRAGRDG